MKNKSYRELIIYTTFGYNVKTNVISFEMVDHSLQSNGSKNPVLRTNVTSGMLSTKHVDN